MGDALQMGLAPCYTDSTVLRPFPQKRGYLNGTVPMQKAGTMGGSFDTQGLDFAKMPTALGTLKTQFAELLACRNGTFGFILACSKQLVGL